MNSTLEPSPVKRLLARGSLITWHTSTRCVMLFFTPVWRNADVPQSIKFFRCRRFWQIGLTQVHPRGRLCHSQFCWTTRWETSENALTVRFVISEGATLSLVNWYLLVLALATNVATCIEGGVIVRKVNDCYSHSGNASILKWALLVWGRLFLFPTCKCGFLSYLRISIIYYCTIYFLHMIYSSTQC